MKTGICQFRQTDVTGGAEAGYETGTVQRDRRMPASWVMLLFVAFWFGKKITSVCIPMTDGDKLVAR